MHEDVINYIQDWFGECSSIQEVAKLYGTIFSEINKQLDEVTEILINDMIKDSEAGDLDND